MYVCICIFFMYLEENTVCTPDIYVREFIMLLVIIQKILVNWPYRFLIIEQEQQNQSLDCLLSPVFFTLGLRANSETGEVEGSQTVFMVQASFKISELPGFHSSHGTQEDIMVDFTKGIESLYLQQSEQSLWKVYMNISCDVFISIILCKYKACFFCLFWYFPYT